MSQIDSFYLANCGNVSGVCGSTPPATPTPVYDGPLLCGKSTPVFPPTDVNTVNNCSDTAFFSVSKGTELYNAYRDSLLGSFGQDYINTGLLAANREVFTVSYTTSEYHYTLFYYDQAGNLVKTVPPAGVVIDRSAAWVNSVKAARAAGQVKVPAHQKVTQYRYNTLNQIVEQQTPDGGISKFWYDKLGRPVLSQNAQQRVTRDYNYTFYDGLGRVMEIGQLRSNTIVNDNLTRNPATLQHFYSSARATCVQITRTTFDIPYAPLSQLVLSARNLRNRIAWTAAYDNATTLGAGNYTAATFYSYDVHGNVDTLLQDYKKGGMADAGNRFKKIVYKYDLISGNVKQVAYQPSQADAFYHRYTYDAENRLINVETSKDSVYWENDAYYQYYRHGALARLVLGQQQVQGLDYAYTLQGWLKGVNSTSIGGSTDMGQDGTAGSPVARDAVGYGLYYYGIRDYNPIGSQAPFAPIEGTGFKSLFNGNIAAGSQHIPALGESLLSVYSYDLLNRLKGTQAIRGLNTTTNKWNPVAIQDFKEGITYDEDGNILTYSRNGNSTFAGKPLAMDNLTYTYKAGKNQLDFVADTVGTGRYDDDIDNQTAGNFAYDSTGNLIKDNAGGITSVVWTVDGKIASITKSDGTVVTYTYDASGNRISQTVNGVQTWYVRDAAGNTISTYIKGNSNVNGGNLTQTEVYLYGLGRLGVSAFNRDLQNVALPDLTNMSGLGAGIAGNFTRGSKSFEISNFHGNVLATVSDKKRGVSNDSATISYFMPDVLSTQEYYSFGMKMAGRGTGNNDYRFGFNGQEKSIGVGTNNYTAQYWEYDSRLGRRWNMDPVVNPGESPYATFANSPILVSDTKGNCPDGKCGDKEKVAAYEVVKKHFDPKKNRKDISAELKQSALEWFLKEYTSGGYPKDTKVGDYAHFEKLVLDTWTGAFASSFFSRFESNDKLIQGMSTSSGKAFAIQYLLGKDWSDLQVFGNVMVPQIMDFFTGAAVGSNPGFNTPQKLPSRAGINIGFSETLFSDIPKGAGALLGKRGEELTEVMIRHAYPNATIGKQVYFYFSKTNYAKLDFVVVNEGKVVAIWESKVNGSVLSGPQQLLFIEKQAGAFGGKAAKEVGIAGQSAEGALLREVRYESGTGAATIISH